MPSLSRSADGPAPAVVSVAALVLVSLALRPQVAAIGPLATLIRDDLGASHAVLGLLTTIPVLCMGLFAPFGLPLARRLGPRRAIAVSVALVALFGVARVAAPAIEVILLLTFGVGLGMGMSGPVLAMFVRSRMPTRLLLGTSAYASGTVIGAALAAAIVVPIAMAASSWRAPLLGLSVAAAIGVIAWLMLATPDPARDPGAPSGSAWPKMPWRRGVAWMLGLAFGMQSWLYYGAIAWLASTYIERGWRTEDAGLLITVLSLAIFGATLLVPSFGRWLPHRRQQLVFSAVLSTIGLLGVSLVPGPAFLWAVILGAGLGSYFALVLTLPTDVSHEPAEVGSMAALMLLVGYLIAAAAPFVLGAARDITGNFSASLWLLVGISAALLPVSWTLTPEHLRRR